MGIIIIMFKLIAALVAAATASMADESSEARILIVRRKLSTYTLVKRLVLKAWGAHPKGWKSALTRVGYMKLARRYGVRKVAAFLHWQKRTMRFWGGRKSATIKWRLYKALGFRRWWLRYRRVIKRTCGSMGKRSYFKRALAATRYAWPRS